MMCSGQKLFKHSFDRTAGFGHHLNLPTERAQQELYRPKGHEQNPESVPVPEPCSEKFCKCSCAQILDLPREEERRLKQGLRRLQLQLVAFWLVMTSRIMRAKEADKRVLSRPRNLRMFCCSFQGSDFGTDWR